MKISNKIPKIWLKGMKKENKIRWRREITKCKSKNEKYNNYNKNCQFSANINKAEKIQSML